MVANILFNLELGQIDVRVVRDTDGSAAFLAPFFIGLLVLAVLYGFVCWIIGGIQDRATARDLKKMEKLEKELERLLHELQKRSKNAKVWPPYLDCYSEMAIKNIITSIKWRRGSEDVKRIINDNYKVYADDHPDNPTMFTRDDLQKYPDLWSFLLKNELTD